MRVDECACKNWVHSLLAIATVHIKNNTYICHTYYTTILHMSYLLYYNTSYFILTMLQYFIFHTYYITILTYFILTILQYLHTAILSTNNWQYGIYMPFTIVLQHIIIVFIITLPLTVLLLHWLVQNTRVPSSLKHLKGRDMA